MTQRGPLPGDVYLVSFPEQDPRGHEQEGLRPALVLAVPARARFPVLLAAPLTTDKGQPWIRSAANLYLQLPQGLGGLPAASVLLLEQTRAIDVARVRRVLGTLDPKTFDSILQTWLTLFK